MTSTNNQQFSSFSLVRFMWQKRKTLILVCCVVAVISLIVSFLIKPKYKSTAIVYAPRTNSVAKILLNEESYNERLDMKAYADEEETEQMMEILNSRTIKDALIEKFNLYTHYDIGEKEAHRQYKIYKNLDQAITVKRTNYGAISVSVIDRDPVMAADMANEIVAQLDSVKHKIEQERVDIAFSLLQKQLELVTEELSRIEDSIKNLMELGVIDFGAQSNRMMQQYAIALSQGNTAGASRLEKELQKLSTWGPQYITQTAVQSYLRGYQNLCRNKMMNVILDRSTEMPVKFVIEEAIPADKKYYPKKSLVVIVSTVASLILSILVLLTIEKIKTLDLTAETSEDDK